MKELAPELKVRDEQVIQAEEKRQQHIGTLQCRKGLTLYEINKETQEVEKAVFVSVDLDVGTDLKEEGLKKKLLMKKECFYVEALNEKNALRKYKKQFGI